MCMGFKHFRDFPLSAICGTDSSPLLDVSGMLTSFAFKLGSLKIHFPGPD